MKNIKCKPAELTIEYQGTFTPNEFCIYHKQAEQKKLIIYISFNRN